MTVVQSQSASGASSVGQAAAHAAFDGGLAFLAPRVAAYQARRDLLLDALQDVPGIRALVPDGGFFVFVDCAALIGRHTPDGRRVSDDEAVVAWLLDHGVAVVAGSAYGLSPCFRVSIATATERVVEAGARIAQACAALHEQRP